MLKKLALILALLTLFSACAMAEPDTDAMLMDTANLDDRGLYGRVLAGQLLRAALLRKRRNQ